MLSADRFGKITGLNAGMNDPHEQTDGRSMSSGSVRVTLSSINEAVWPSCCR
jgi:hypothetical protein